MLRNRKDIATLLGEAVATVRRLTGFERVMAYRFHRDDSGEVVTEEREPALEPFLHRRFPASDIPLQARALYVRNPLRLIADVSDEQVPIDAHADEGRPLDLSHSVLRSVSPIHIEYLRNIQVGGLDELVDRGARPPLGADRLPPWRGAPRPLRGAHDLRCAVTRAVARDPECGGTIGNPTAPCAPPTSANA